MIRLHFLLTALLLAFASHPLPADPAPPSAPPKASADESLLTELRQTTWDAVARDTTDLLQRLIRIDTTNPPSPAASAGQAPPSPAASAGKSPAAGAALDPRATPPPSPAPGPVWRETEAVRLIADELAKDGIASQIYESIPGRGNLVARLPADAPASRPGGALVLTAHIDVVGVERDKWSVDPFAGVVKDGYLYGRGAVDDKGMAAAATTVMRLLAREKVPLARDVILCINADEESSGKFGMVWLLEKHPEALAGAAFALNEGGKVIQQRQEVRAVWIQTAEKQYLDLALTARGTAGHSSRPLPDNAIGTMSRGLARLSTYTCPFRPNATTLRFFRGMAALEGEPLATSMRSLDHADPAVARRAAEAVAERNPLFASMLRTSIAPTIFRSGIRENVLPSIAEANVNCRLLPGEDLSAFVAEIQRVLDEPRISVAFEKRVGPEPAPSSFDTPAYAAIEAACRRAYPDAVIVPYMSTGATDSRFMRARGIQCYGFDPFPITAEDGERIHGHDERMAVAGVGPGVRLLYDAVQRAARARRYDVLLKGARVLDGTGRDAFESDIGIACGRIARVGPSEPDAVSDLALDARGLIAAPGFIDLHSHADDDLVQEARRLYPNDLTQGVTTVVTGNCGSGPVDVAAYLASLDRQGVGVNVIHLVPHGAVRAKIVGEVDRAATPAELDRMRELVDAGMKAGAWGMSTGLQYVPGCFAPFDELVELTKVVGKRGGLYATHVRDERARLVESVAEAIRVGEAAGAPAHISHLKASTRPAWGKTAEACAAIEEARGRGLRVTADQYPYTAYSTGLSPALLPPWAREGGDEALKRRLDDATDGPRIRHELEQAVQDTGGPDNIRFTWCSEHKAFAGQTLQQAADALGVSPVEAVVRILRGGGGGILAFSMREEDVRAVMGKPYVATASDWGVATPGEGRPHPRAYGTFARKIRAYAIDEHVVTLPAAVRSCSGLPAEILGLEDRGVIREGAWADLVLFDPQTYRDEATYDDPHRPAGGVKWAFVNGVLAVADGKLTGAAAGRVLRLTEAKRAGGGEGTRARDK